MIHDVSIPAALIAGFVSFLSPCVLPLVPPYLIYLTGATIEHVANDETASSSKRAVMISAGGFVLGVFSAVARLGSPPPPIGGVVRPRGAEGSISPASSTRWACFWSSPASAFSPARYPAPASGCWRRSQACRILARAG